MQAYLNFIDKINKLIEGANDDIKFKFALDICKKLYPDYVSFAIKNNCGDVVLLQESMDFCEKSFINKGFDNQLLDEFIKKLDAITTGTDDFSSWEVSYASNASQAVYELLKFIKESKNQHISDICSLMIDTVDFKIAATNEHLSDEGIFKHPLMLETMNEIIEKIKN